MDYAVERLRDATTNRDAIVANLIRPGETTEEQFERAARESQPMRQAVEDTAIHVLGELYHERFAYHDVEQAIATADAAWLYPVILDRALDAIGGDA